MFCLPVRPQIGHKWHSVLLTYKLWTADKQKLDYWFKACFPNDASGRNRLSAKQLSSSDLGENCKKTHEKKVGSSTWIQVGFHCRTKITEITVGSLSKKNKSKTSLRREQMDNFKTLFTHFSRQQA